MGDTHIFKSHHDEETAQLRARIAELEAEMQDTFAHIVSLDFMEWLEGVHELWTQAEAELAEREARRCETCYYVNMCGIQTAMQCDAGCNLWHAHTEEGSEEGSEDE